MAIACQCDRCGKFYGYVPEKRYKGRFVITLNFERDERAPHYRDESRVDICDDCMNEFERFMNVKKENERGKTDCDDCES